MEKIESWWGPWYPLEQCVSHDVKMFRHARLQVKAIHDTARTLLNTTIVEILNLDRGE
jgi:hypothetical protein